VARQQLKKFVQRANNQLQNQSGETELEVENPLRGNGEEGRNPGLERCPEIRL